MEKGSLQSSQTDLTGLATEGIHSFLHSAIQQPIDGVSQIADRMLNTSLQPSLQLISAPSSAEFGTAKWHAQQIGGALGMTADYLLLSKVMKGSSKDAFQRVESVSMSMSTRVGTAAINGAVYESLFRASAPEQNLLASRLKQGMAGAATFATLTAARIGLGQTLGAGMPASKLAEVAAGTISGAPAGVVSAQLSSILEGKGLASATDSLKSAYTFAVVGGTLGTLHSLGRTEGSSRREIQLRKLEPAAEAATPLATVHGETVVKPTTSTNEARIKIPGSETEAPKAPKQLTAIQTLEVPKVVEAPVQAEIKLRLSDLNAERTGTSSPAQSEKLDSKLYRFVPSRTDIRLSQMPTMISLEPNAEPSIVFGKGGVESIRFPQGMSADATQKLQLAAGYAEIIMSDGQAAEAASEIRRQSIGFVSKEIKARGTFEQMQSNAVTGALDYILGRTGNRFTEYLVERYGPMTPAY